MVGGRVEPRWCGRGEGRCKTEVRRPPRLPSNGACCAALRSSSCSRPRSRRPRAAQGTELMPGVTYERTVTFTPHGVVVLHVITAPRPGGLYALAPVLARGTLHGRARAASRRSSATSRDGDHRRDRGRLLPAPTAGRAACGSTAGCSRIRRSRAEARSASTRAGRCTSTACKLFGTWQGTGQRRTLTGLNQAARPGADGALHRRLRSAHARRRGRRGSGARVVSRRPRRTPISPAPSRRRRPDGGEPIPSGGAVLMAAGAAAAKLQAEAPVGTTIRTRLGLQPSWDGVTAALGGGPVLVRNGKAVFRSLEDFTNDQIGARTARGAVGQLADGRIVLVAVDGGRPGYSAGLTSFELAQALVRLGAVTAAGVDPGDSVTAAFDGRLLNRPSGRSERAVKEALLVQYFGVYAPEPPLPLLTGEPGLAAEPLSYKVVRPSTVTAHARSAPTARRTARERRAHAPGTYAFTACRVRSRRDVALGRLGDRRPRARRRRSSARSGTTPRCAPRRARDRRTRRLRVGFTLARPAQVTLAIETPRRRRRARAARRRPAAGGAVARWDGRLPRGTRRTPAPTSRTCSSRAPSARPTSAVPSGAAGRVARDLVARRTTASFAVFVLMFDRRGASRRRASS